MPYKETASLDRPCQDRECPHPASILLVGANDSICYCSAGSHLEAAVIPWIRRAPAASGDCVGCSSQAPRTFQLDVGGYEARVCEGHAIYFLTCTLDPVSYSRFCQDAGDVAAIWHLDEQHYSEDGEALWPIPVGEVSVADYLFDLFTGEQVPEDFDPEVPVCERPDVIERMQQAFASFTGYPIAEDVAHAMVHEVMDITYHALEAGERYGDPPTDEIRERYRSIIQDILRRFDPQGVVAAHLETDPYRKEALWLSRRIQGYEDERVDMLYLLVEEALQYSGEEELDEHTGRLLSQITARLLAHVVLPLREELGIDVAPEDT